MLDLYPGLADFRIEANHIVSDLREIHENYLLRNVSRDIGNGCLVKTTLLKAEAEKAANSLIGVAGYRNLEKINRHLSANKNIVIYPLTFEAEKVCKLLGKVNEQKLIQKLANFVPSLDIPSLNDLSIHANNLIQNMKLVHERKILYSAARICPIYKFSDVSSLKINGAKLSRNLVNLADFRMLKNLDNFAQPISKPNLAQFAESANWLKYSLKSAHETRFISSIFHAEQKRQRMIADCWRFAKWAGDDLQKWEKVFDKFENQPKNLRILENMIDSAHSKLALILSDTRNLAEIRDRCGDDPFLQHEYGILLKKVEQYYAVQGEQEAVQANRAKTDRDVQDIHRSTINFRP